MCSSLSCLITGTSLAVNKCKQKHRDSTEYRHILFLVDLHKDRFIDSLTSLLCLILPGHLARHKKLKWNGEFWDKIRVGTMSGNYFTSNSRSRSRIWTRTPKGQERDQHVRPLIVFCNYNRKPSEQHYTCNIGPCPAVKITGRSSIRKKEVFWKKYIYIEQELDKCV